MRDHQLAWAAAQMVCHGHAKQVLPGHPDDLCVPLQDFYELSPEKFQNKTNGVTPRRWLAYCNPGLSKLITKTLGSNEWISKTDQLTGLRQHADDKAFQKEWRSIKLENKQRLADLIKVWLMEQALHQSSHLIWLVQVT